MNKEQLLKEIVLKTSRSSGPGGQHLNKAETAVLLFWDVLNTMALDESERQLVLAKLKNKISKEGILSLQVTKHRSQLQNKELASVMLLELVERALYVAPTRKPTKPSSAKNEKRLQAKKMLSERKKQRRGDF